MTTANASGGFASYSGVGITQPGVYRLTASALGSPWSGLATATSELVTVNFPVPSVALITPGQIVAGQAGPTTLTLSGSGFFSQSVVELNSIPLATSYVSPTVLKATIPASDVAALGLGTITVTNPTPGGGVSPGKALPVLNSPPPGTGNHSRYASDIPAQGRQKGQAGLDGRHDRLERAA
jgi:hypothetical protein